MFEKVAERFGFPIVDVPISADSRDAIVRQLASALSSSRQLTREGIEEIVETVRKRELLGSTATGHGSALPRGLTKAVSAPTGVIGHVRHGVQWDECSGVVTAVCLVLCPSNCERVGDYGQMLMEATREERASRS